MMILKNYIKDEKGIDSAIEKLLIIVIGFVVLALVAYWIWNIVTGATEAGDKKLEEIYNLGS